MKINCKVKAPCDHPGTGLGLVPGEMEVTERQAKTLINAKLATLVTEKSEASETKPAAKPVKGKE